MFSKVILTIRYGEKMKVIRGGCFNCGKYYSEPKCKRVVERVDGEYILTVVNMCPRCNCVASKSEYKVSLFPKKEKK